MWTRRVVLLLSGVFCIRVAGTVHVTGQDHIGQYARSDIERGAQVYRAQSATCHGPNGNNVGLLIWRASISIGTT